MIPRDQIDRIRSDPPGCGMGSQCDGLATLRWEFEQYRGDLAAELSKLEGRVVRHIGNLILTSHEDLRRKLLEDLGCGDRPSMVTINLDAVKTSSLHAGRRRGWKDAAIAIGSLIGTAVAAYLATS